ncbi:MAG: hypothetical protein ACFFCI_10220 [Promethearchaeota archaeon]
MVPLLGHDGQRIVCVFHCEGVFSRINLLYSASTLSLPLNIFRKEAVTILHSPNWYAPRVNACSALSNSTKVETSWAIYTAMSLISILILISMTPKAIPHAIYFRILFTVFILSLHIKTF